MKVLHLVHNFPPEITGGTERYVHSLIGLQQEAGLEVEVFCGSEERRDQKPSVETVAGARITRFFRRAGEEYGVLFQPPAISKELQLVVRRFRPDIIHVHHWFNLGHTMLTQLPHPIVATFHDAYVACPRFFLLQPNGEYCGNDMPIPLQRCVNCVASDDGAPRLEQRLQQRRDLFAAEIRCVDLALTPSQFHADILTRVGVLEESKVRVLPLGVPGTTPRPAHESSSGPLRVVCFGNLSKVKGVDLLLEALAQISPDLWQLHLYGKLLDTDAKELLAQAEGLPVKLFGRYQPEDLWQAAERIDLAVFPSRAYETYSLVLEEAVALGIPAIVSDRGALPERVKDSRFVVAVNNAQPLVEALQAILADRSILEDRRQELGSTFQTTEAHEQQLREWYGEL